ncbi:hypothetical protein ABZ070_07345 [Streptomyces sp. NPDC006283]|uniref:hypothetical protein n=1 Tax=Streptomyces sp. NPDC006283 TaxID=3156741 RepID=UPI0033A46107
MGIESDQLVYDYLSRVGDLAQQAQLPSGARMRLVTTLRSEIDKQRAKFGGDSPAGVRRILGRLGTPDEVVASAASSTTSPSPTTFPTASPAAVSEPQDTGSSRAAPGAASEDSGGGAMPRQRGWRRVPRPRRADTPAPAPRPAVSPPHLAGMDELGPSGSEPDWWRIDPGPFGSSDSVAGFVGGVEIPEILKPPSAPDDAAQSEAEPEPARVAEPEAAPGGRRRLLRRLLRRGGTVVAEPAQPAQPEPAARAGFGSPMLLLAAALLVAGAVLGSLIALGLGWLLAYGSRRLSRAEVKLAVLGLPGTVATGALLWLWGRINGHWGEPVPEGGMRDVLTEMWPWVLRGAAVASALFLVWRGRRAR